MLQEELKIEIMGKNKKTIQKPNINEMEIALKNSGYLLEQRICPILEDYHFKVETNIQYEDIDTGKSCEFDVKAIRTIKILPDTTERIADFDVVILISCKNNYFPVVGFTRTEIPIRETPYDPSTIICGVPYFVDGWPLEVYFDFRKFYHYFDSKYVASQYCMVTKKRNEEEYKADHRDLYDDIYKLFKVIHSIKNSDNKFLELLTKDINSSVKDGKHQIHIKIVYPILLFGGNLYEYRLSGKHSDIINTDHIILWQTISSINLKGAYFIDMITEAYLTKFLKRIDTEIEEIRWRFAENIEAMEEGAFRDLARLHEEITRQVFGEHRNIRQLE